MRDPTLEELIERANTLALIRADIRTAYQRIQEQLDATYAEARRLNYVLPVLPVCQPQQEAPSAPHAHFG
jgi:hypothetical protein